MQIDSNVNIRRYNTADSVGQTRTTATNPTASDTPEASFEAASGLDRALAAVPAVRPEAVSRAKELIANPDYPSAQNIRQLSTFLAGKLLANEEQ